MFLLLKNYPAKSFSPGVNVNCPPSSYWLGCHMLSSKPWSQVWHVATFVLPPVSQLCQAHIVSPQATFNPQFQPKSACTTSPPALTLWDCLIQQGFTHEIQTGQSVQHSVGKGTRESRWDSGKRSSSKVEKHQESLKKLKKKWGEIGM